MTKLNTFADIRNLDKSRALVLSCALIQRMLPNYLLFCEVSETEHQQSATNLVNLFWEVTTNKAMKLNTEAQGEKLEEITPNVDEFDTFGVYAALDFCMACSAYLQLISNDEPHAAVMIAKLSQGSVERHITISEEVELTGADLRAHPLMSFEIESLQWLLAECSEKKLKSDDIKALRKEIVEQGVSNLGIEY
jgi:uncharacterized protein YjaG (DUF416 family)